MFKKKWRVTQESYIKYGRYAGEFVDLEYRDYRFLFVARLSAWFYSGVSISGVMTLRTKVTALSDGRKM